VSDVPASSVFGWEISARRDGDVLVARANGHGIELVLLSRQAGHDPTQIEAWLAELIGVAVETSRNDPGERPISALLRHALTGLLFSHAELWHHTPDAPPCSLAFVTTNDRVAFGWAGPAEVNIWVDDQPSEGPVIRVRDPDGNEAQAVEVESWRRMRVGLTWHAATASGAPAEVEVNAGWPGRAAVEAAPARGAGPAGAVPGWRAPSWLGQQAPWEQGAAQKSQEQAAPPEPAAAAPRPRPLPLPMTVPTPVVDTPSVVRPAPELVQQMTQEERAAELAPEAPAPTAPAPELVQQMTQEERAAELAPEAPAQPEPARIEALPPELAPAGPGPSEPVSAEPVLDIIRPFSASAPAGAPAGPPPGIEIVRAPEPVFQTTTPQPVVLRAPAPAAPAAIPTPVVARAPEPAPRAATTPPVALRRPEPVTPAAAPPSMVEHEPEPITPRLESTPIGDSTQGPPPGRGAGADAEDDSSLTAWAARTPASRATSSPGTSRRVRHARRPAWPSESEPSRPPWRRGAPIGIAVLVLFAVGWLLGGFAGGHHGEPGGGPMARMMARLGMGPAHYQLVVDSHPQGAWIVIDDRDLARRTPATIDVEPGTHQVSLSFADLGHAVYEVKGEKGSRVALDATLWGSLAVKSMDNTVAVKVGVDGNPRGLAPVTIDSLAPGVHQVQFWSPGAGSWDQIVEVRVRETAELVARPIASPSTGLLEVRAMLSGEGAPQSVAGAVVWLDGERRGVTPLTLELPRGPHSVRVTWHGQDSPVQVIDLPGGNQRFANFDLGGEIERPHLNVLPPGRLSPDAPTVISATLDGLSATDVREMWLHVSTPAGQWRRYAMNVLQAPGGAAGALVFPAVQLDSRGRARFYVSVSTRSGDELFTDIQTALGPANADAASTR
jgi:hypothetical protein